MFDRDEIERAVDLQARSYELLRWVSSAIEKGFISFDAAHTYSSLPAAAEGWIDKHYVDIPSRARPPRSSLGDFCGIFSTYLENSFDLVRDPGKRLLSPEHCFRLVDAPNLKAKKPTIADRKRAHKMMLARLNWLAAEHGVTLPDGAAIAMIDDAELREALALCTYGSDLLRRMRGIAAGPATLVLWRAFAWDPKGAPKKKFRLKADAIIKAEFVLRDRVLAYAT